MNTFAQQLPGVTPVSNVVYGGFWRRFVAYVIDGIILMILCGPCWLFLATIAAFHTAGRSASSSHFWVSPLGYLISILISCVYFGYFYSQKSASPGKMAMSLKVLRPNGDRLSVRRSVGRLFGVYLSGLILNIGYIIAAFDSQKRALHDYICDTRVFKA